MHLAFVFPGTGTQYAGMGKDLYQEFSLAREIYGEADEALGFPLSRACFDEAPGALAAISVGQPALLTHSVVLTKLMRRAGIHPMAVAGPSLGEFAALVAAGVIAFADAVRLVYRRAKLIEQIRPAAEGSMLAVMGVPQEIIQQWCYRASRFGQIEIANRNAPGQVVLSGEHAALNEAARLVKASGEGRAVKLDVRYPFHSSLMRPVEAELGRQFSEVPFRDAQLPVVCNVDGTVVVSGRAWKKLLLFQLCSPVHWDSTVRGMVGRDVSCFLELGPGRVLQRLIRRIQPGAEVLSAQCSRSLRHTVDQLGSWRREPAWRAEDSSREEVEVCVI
jgi:[acyl-carrier-protein] S-malonyltransferase